MSQVLEQSRVTTREASSAPQGSHTALRWVIGGCAAFWVAVGVGVAHALGN